MSLDGATATTTALGFLSRRWSIGKLFGVSIALGLATPLLNKVLFDCLNWHAAPLVFLPLLALTIGVLYWSLDRAQFRADLRAMVATAGAGLLWAGGAVASGWCFLAHICMGGHMEHPPYSLWHYAADVAWPLALALAAIWARCVRSPLCLAFGFFSAFIISHRFVFHSLGGKFVWLPL